MATGSRPAHPSGIPFDDPGVFDTELFHLPDNEQGFHQAVDALRKAFDYACKASGPGIK